MFSARVQSENDDNDDDDDDRQPTAHRTGNVRSPRPGPSDGRKNDHARHGAAAPRLSGGGRTLWGGELSRSVRPYTGKSRARALGRSGGARARKIRGGRSSSAPGISFFARAASVSERTKFCTPPPPPCRAWTHPPPPTTRRRRTVGGSLVGRWTPPSRTVPLPRCPARGVSLRFFFGYRCAFYRLGSLQTMYFFFFRILLFLPPPPPPSPHRAVGLPTVENVDFDASGPVSRFSTCAAVNPHAGQSNYEGVIPRAKRPRTSDGEY